MNSWRVNEALPKLQTAISTLCSWLDITDAASIEYLTENIRALQPYLTQSLKINRLDTVFPSLNRSREITKPEVSYIDSTPMDDDRLRDLINELSDCRFLTDKIAMVKQNVHSLRDYFEILNICFWDDECQALFDTLSHEELKHLRLAVKQKQSKFPEWKSETGWELILCPKA
jgi:hypothetical protein